MLIKMMLFEGPAEFCVSKPEKKIILLIYLDLLLKYIYISIAFVSSLPDPPTSDSLLYPTSKHNCCSTGEGRKYVEEM